MDITSIRKSSFVRDSSGDEDLLDDYWRMELPQIAKQDKRLERFFEKPDYSDIDLSIAGKSDGVNDSAYQTAIEILPDLHLYLDQCDKDIKLASKNGWWTLSSILVPYQEEKIWYLTFLCEYGSEINYCFVWNKNAYSGLVSGWRNCDSIAHVLPTVKYVVTELSTIKHVDSDEFKQILQLIESNETLGREFINPLISIVKSHRELIGDLTADHCLKLLSEISCNAL